ncbi:MAG: hypothetical protein O8C64_15160 [Candidatus Methanoperedens sp.]|nr:hypothetical protein [Candidatus Methanoperedens sp.]MCZ7403833.1 hypothetical protein [Candidatus Methanoperedens sp.]
MVKVILQPAGNKGARKHYTDTIANPVDLSRIKSFVKEPEFTRLNELYKDGKVPTWGVTPGKNETNKHDWESIESGDIVLFAKGGFIFASGVVSFRIHNKSLALDLWGKNDDGETWEYIYFLDELKNHQISYEDFNKVVGYKPNYIIQGFRVLDDKKSTDILNALDLESEIYYPDITEEEYRNAVRKFDPTKPLDSEGKVLIRKEQSFLRKFLFTNKKFSTCGICGKEFPVELLVAAHIKKRAECSADEKLDYKNIVMPMCKLGCDALYENGYITVIDGKIVICNSGHLTRILIEYTNSLKDRSCMAWNSNSSKYFKWHNKFAFKNSI